MNFNFTQDTQATTIPDTLEMTLDISHLDTSEDEKSGTSAVEKYDSTPCETKQRVLVTMAIGLTLKGVLFDKAALEDKELLPQKRKRVWKPTVVSLTEEMDRRKEQLGQDLLLKSQLRSQSLRLDWLVSNPIINREDIAFVTKKMEHWIELNEKTI